MVLHKYYTDYTSILILLLYIIMCHTFCFSIYCWDSLCRLQFGFPPV